MTYLLGIAKIKGPSKKKLRAEWQVHTLSNPGHRE
jgi:hypothetical protein